MIKEQFENRERIGRAIASERKKKGLTLRQLEDICGVPLQNLTKIEHGKYNVSIDILGKVCLALDIRIELT